MRKARIAVGAELETSVKYGLTSQG